MVSGTVYRVLERAAPRKAIDFKVRMVAEQIRSELVAATPRDTGRLAGGWKLQKGRVPGVWLIVNNVPYARHREFGGRRPFMGPIMANWRSKLGRR